MVNLAFCKLDVPYLISSDNSEAHQSSISIYISLQRDGHSCWNFGIDLLRASGLVLSKWLMVFLVICCSDFVSRRDLRLLTDPEGWSVDFVDLGSWSDLLDALVSWWIFSNNRGRWFRSRPVIFLNFLGSFDFFGRFCLPLCLCIILTWNPIDYHISHLLLVVHQRIRCFSGSSLWL